MRGRPGNAQNQKSSSTRPSWKATPSSATMRMLVGIGVPSKYFTFPVSLSPRAAAVIPHAHEGYVILDRDPLARSPRLLSVAYRKPSRWCSGNLSILPITHCGPHIHTPRISRRSRRVTRQAIFMMEPAQNRRRDYLSLRGGDDRRTRPGCIRTPDRESRDPSWYATTACVRLLDRFPEVGALACSGRRALPARRSGER